MPGGAVILLRTQGRRAGWGPAATASFEQDPNLTGTCLAGIAQLLAVKLENVRCGAAAVRNFQAELQKMRGAKKPFEW